MAGWGHCHCHGRREDGRAEQLNSVKGKRQDDGLSAATRKQRTWRSCSRSRKRQTTKMRTPSSFAASCPSLWPFPCAPGASPTVLAFPAVVFRGPSTDSVPIAESAAGPFCASFPLGSLSPPVWG